MLSTTSDRLKQIMKEKNLKQIDILRLAEPYLKKYGIKLGSNALSNYVTGKVKPKQDKLTVLALALNVSESWLLGADVPMNTVNKHSTLIEKISEITEKLEKERQNKVLIYVKNEFEEQNKIKENNVMYSVKAVSGAAAGVGYAYDNQDIEEYYTDKDLPRYDYATVVCGDSMEPNFSDGDIVLIKSGYNGSNGEIHVVDFDGKSFIKKLYHDGDRLRLISTNTKYDPIYITLPTDTYLNIVGKVVGSFTPKKQK